MRRFFSLITLVALFGMALAGCSQGITAQEIVQKMRDTAATTNTAHIVISGAATVTGTPIAGEKSGSGEQAMSGSGQLTVEAWFKKPNLVRIEVQSSSQSQINGAMLLHDGADFWAYQPDKKVAFKVSGDAIRGLGAQANIPADLQDLLANPSLEDMIDRILALTDYTLLGEEHVGQFDTYKLDLKPKSGSSVAGAAGAALAGLTATIWVDKTTWAIVKAEANAPQGNGSVEVTTLDLNTPIDDSQFQFTLPAGGHVIDLSNMVPRSMNIDQARQSAKASGWTLLEPSYVPAGATLVQIMGSQGVMGKPGSYVLSYSGGANTPTFWISESKGGNASEMAQQEGSDKSWTSKTTTVNGNSATVAGDATGKVRAVFWTDKASGLSLAVGGQISEEELLKVAASLK